jgi:hypothetical protein
MSGSVRFSREVLCIVVVVVDYIVDHYRFIFYFSITYFAPGFKFYRPYLSFPLIAFKSRMNSKKMWEELVLITYMSQM